MKLLFYFPNENSVRKATLSYTSLENGCGFSGTETALLELSKYLVDRGHSVQIYGVSSSYIDNGIKFISEQDLHSVDLDVDWYSPIFFFTNSQNLLLERLNRNRTKVFLWFQCFINNDIINYLQNKYKVYAQYLSKYVADSYTDIINPKDSWIVFNGVNKYFTTEIIPSTQSKKGNWIFHPVFERGGNVVKQIFSKINKLKPDVAKTLNMLSYYTPDLATNSCSSNIINQGSKTKLEVRDFLLNSDYFVYPLVLPDGRVHHDTFGSCMLEALACGVIVVVWDVACITSVYSDLVVKIPVPEHVKKYYNPKARFDSCRWMLSDEAQALFVDKILELESDQTKKELIRSKGVKLARRITWDVLGTTMEKELSTH